ncbi:hypothetical protein Afil01_65010 [Actinorhabdospora filicis]|uniref:non-specific serine/threonine protein kinase n=1 Tax=Actinorhabdospora filicis TaxID=1785913 RepID=A0A9W6WCJ2_9ACTN|nr:serine/threonine-protein kinase [Actinorhabdospora filicis]GLZ81694.1 hypothetical protein Afil01_65010 [Actinorhabdospora filicis]
MLRAGDVLGDRYRLTGRVGGGGMGDVWCGEDIVLRRKVAVKVLLARYADAEDFRERFRREARAIACLESPAIVDVYDYDECVLPDGEEVSYLVMQFIEGEPLSRRLGSWGRLHVGDALRLVAQAADALQVAHEAGIIHRDIKPANMLVRPDGRLVLVDFGIARDPSAATLTATGAVMGTATYMSPEQASGVRVTAASDVYSLGVVAHQALSGESPFAADTPFVVASMHVRQPPPPLPDDIPEAVREFVAISLSKDPADRWPSAARMAQAARRLAEAPHRAVVMAGAPGPVFEAPPLRAPEPRPEPRPGVHRLHRGRRARLVALVLGLAVLLASAVAVAAEPWAAPPGQDTGGGNGRHLDAQKPAEAPVEPVGAPSVSRSVSASPSASRSASAAPSASRSASAVPSASPTPEGKAVPLVIGMSEENAKKALSEAGFVPEVGYFGEGVACTVSEQSPGGGGSAPAGSTVRVTVQRGGEGCGA